MPAGKCRYGVADEDVASGLQITDARRYEATILETTQLQ